MNKFVVLVALSLAGFVLSGCSPQPSQQPPITATVFATKTAKPTHPATQTSNSIKPAYSPLPTEAISPTPTPTTLTDYLTIYPTNPIPPALLAATPSVQNDRLIAFSSVPYASHPDIYTIQFDGSDLKQLTNNPANDQGPNWSKDGKKIIFYSDRNHKNCDENGCAFESFIINLDGTGSRKLTPDLPEFTDPNVSPSPDGKYRVNINQFYDPLRLQHGMGDDLSDILVETVGGSHQKNITGALQPGSFQDIRWSASGKRFAFTGITNPLVYFDHTYEGRAYFPQDVYLANEDGSAMQKLPGGPFWDSQSAKAWSPDGKRLAFLTAKGIATIQADGSGFSEYAVDRNIGHREIYWLEAGEQLVFTDADDQYYKINADFTGLEKLPLTTEIDKLIYRFELLQVQTMWHDHAQMVLSPDKKWIAYLSNPQLRVISTETRESYFVHNIEDTINLFKDEDYPVYTDLFGRDILWSPDSRQLIFTQSFRYGLIIHPYQGLFAIHLDGTGLRKITDDAWFPKIQP